VKGKAGGEVRNDDEEEGVMKRERRGNGKKVRDGLQTNGGEGKDGEEER